MRAISIIISIISFICLICLHTACSPCADLRIIEHSISVHEFTGDVMQSTATVRGTAINQGNCAAQNCVVSVTFYNYQGEAIGQYSDARLRLEAGEVWNFKVDLKGRETWKVARYSISAANK